MARTKTPAKTETETPVQLLGHRKERLEGFISDTERQMRAGERKRERLQAQRAAYLEELRGVDEAIERLGGLPGKGE